MRKSSILLSMLVVAAMVLAACGAEETSTNVPGTDAPPATVEATPTEAGAVTESPTDGTPGVPVTGDVNPARLSNQLDFNVWDQDGERIGEVNDMVLDLDNSTVAYVIVGVGGFLEIGEKDVLVPWNSLQLETGTGEMTGGEQNAFIFQGDQELFNNAPDTDINAVLPERGTPAGDWDNDIRNYWESGVVPATAAPDGTPVPDMTETVSPEATALPEGTEMPGEPLPLDGIVLASELLGSNITIGVPAQGEVQDPVVTDATAMPDATATADTAQDVPESVEAGIADVIVAVDTGEIQYIVVNAFLDDGERWIPVPLGILRWNPDNGAFILNVDPVTLRDAPFFEDDLYPDTTLDGWNSEFDTFWQNNP